MTFREFHRQRNQDGNFENKWLKSTIGNYRWIPHTLDEYVTDSFMLAKDVERLRVSGRLVSEHDVDDSIKVRIQYRTMGGWRNFDSGTIVYASKTGKAFSFETKYVPIGKYRIQFYLTDFKGGEVKIRNLSYETKTESK